MMKRNSGGGILLAAAAGLAVSAAAKAQIVNGDFETGDLTGWTITSTLPSPVIDTTAFHGGTHSALLGTNSGAEPLGDGAMYQSYAVPAGGASLTFWYKTFTTDSISFDWQDAYIQDSNGTILATIFHLCQTAGWTQQTVDLTPYAGTTIRIAFLVHQDGFGDDTSMNIDDVAVSLPGATGACCLPTGACNAGVTSAACTAAGGIYQGDNSTCGTCPQPGACCVVAGCVIALPSDCTAQAGTYQGAGTTCATANCPQPCPPITGTMPNGPSIGWPSTHGTQNTRLFRDGVADTCAAPGVPGTPIAGSFAYDKYDFVNTSGSGACVRVDINTACTGTNFIYAGAYIGAYDPNNPTVNNVASCGSSPNPTASMSFNVPANTPFSIVFAEVTPGAGCPNYTFQLSGGALNCNSSPCYANCDSSTQQPCLNVLDFSCFLNAFAAGATYANCDNSTQVPVLNVLDFSCFLNRFAAGCSSC